jgi:hypothetical protein
MGVQFHSYSTGILSYAQISADGQIMVTDNGHRRSTYSASIIGYGALTNKAGKPIRFLTQHAALVAAVKKFKQFAKEKAAS